MTLRDAIIKHMSGTSALVSDLDKTMVSGRWIQDGYGYPLLKGTIRRGEYLKATGLAIDAMRIQLLLRSKRNSDGAEVEGLAAFYKILIAHREGRKADMERHALEYFKSHEVTSVMGLVNRFMHGPKVIATQGGSTGAEVAKQHFRFNASVSNLDTFYVEPNKRLSGIDIVIRSGEQKAKLVSDKLYDAFGRRLKDCVAFGDGLADIPMLMGAKVRIASPYARPEVLALPGIIPLSEFIR